MFTGLLMLGIKLTTHQLHTSLFSCQLGHINKNTFSCYFIFLLFPVVYVFFKKEQCITQKIHHLFQTDFTFFLPALQVGRLLPGCAEPPQGGV